MLSLRSLAESADRLWAHCRALSVVCIDAPDTALHRIARSAAVVGSYLRMALEKSSLSFEFKQPVSRTDLTRPRSLN